jgi:hypothetical protein
MAASRATRHRDNMIVLLEITDDSSATLNHLPDMHHIPTPDLRSSLLGKFSSLEEL